MEKVYELTDFIEDHMLILFSLVLIISLVISGTMWYLESTREVTITSTVVDKEIDHWTQWIYITDSKGNFQGMIPIYHTSYHLIMKNGEVVSVSSVIYGKTNIGDSYTYQKRIWK